MFAPVVKSVHLGLTADAVGARRGRRGRATRSPRRRGRSTWRSRPTCSRPRSPAATPRPRTPRHRALAPDLDARRSRVLDGAERPLLWVGGGARDARGAVAALAERLAAPVLTTYGAAGILPPGHPCAVGLPPHAAAAGALWDEADVVARDRLRPRRRPDPELRPAAAADADRGLARAARRTTAPTSTSRATRATSPPRSPSGVRARDGLDALASGCRGARRGLRRARRDRAALPRRDPLRRPRRRRPRRRHVHPRLLARRLPHPRRAARASRSRSAGARSATPSPPPSAPRWPAPTARSSRSPATAASSSPAASSPRWPRSRSR